MPSTTTPTYSSPLSKSTTTHTKTPFQQQPAQKKRIMSITQTYYLAHKARAKLSSEAARSDHDLRLLVGHANLLDSLMLELADAEREQESWFNQSVRGATHHEEEKAEKKQQHIRWADATVSEDEEEEDEEDEWHADDASISSDDSSEFDSDEEDVEMADLVSLRRLPSAPMAPAKPLLSVEEDDDDMEEDDLEEDYAQLELVRTTSHSNSPPELIEHDLQDSDSSDDESMPPSPPNTILTFTEKEAKEQQSQTAKFYSEASIFRKSSPTSIVSAISVY